MKSQILSVSLIVLIVIASYGIIFKEEISCELNSKEGWTIKETKKISALTYNKDLHTRLLCEKLEEKCEEAGYTCK